MLRSHFRPPLRPLVALIPMLAALGGCSGIAPPKFVITKVAITEQTPEGIVFTFTIEGQNRSAEPLPLREVNYSFWLDGRQVFTGARSAELTLSRYSTQILSLPVSASMDPTEPPLVGEFPYRFAGSITYELPGAIAETLFDNNVRRPSASFSESGKLTITDPQFTGPAASPATPKQ